MKPTVAFAAAVLAASTLISGCATEQMKQDVADAKTMAAEAKAAAEQAQSSADSAASQADMAMDAARGAQACCDANSERVDRMFRKAMMK
jgi:hypothetical protein